MPATLTKIRSTYSLHQPTAMMSEPALIPCAFLPFGWIKPVDPVFTLIRVHPYFM